MHYHLYFLVLNIDFCFSFFATGDSFSDLQYSFRISANTIGKIVQSLAILIFKMLSPIYLPEPNEEMWKRIGEEYLHYRQIPNCLGSIDGKHVRLQKPGNMGSMYYNYKNFHSLVLMASVGANYEFTVIDVGACGSANDNAVFRNSNFGKKFFSNKLNIPNGKPYPGENSPSPYYFIADEAFPLLVNLMRPFSGRSISSENARGKNIFNYRLSRGRLNVECAFGILRSKFRVYDRPLATSIDVSRDIVKATCVLHNFIRIEDRPHVNETEISMDFKDKYTDNLQAIPTQTGIRRTTFDAMAVRNHLMEYFESDVGQVSWQNVRTNPSDFN